MQTPGKERGKGGKGSVVNISPDESTTKDQQEVGDGVKQAMEEVMATMHSISSKAEENSLELGVVPKAEVELEGELVRALLDTESPVTIVSLEFLLQVWARRGSPQLSGRPRWRGGWSQLHWPCVTMVVGACQ